MTTLHGQVPETATKPCTSPRLCLKPTFRFQEVSSSCHVPCSMHVNYHLPNNEYTTGMGITNSRIISIPIVAAVILERCQLTTKLWNDWILDTWRWDRWVVPKRRYEITNTRCVITQFTEVLRDRKLPHGVGYSPFFVIGRSWLVVREFSGQIYPWITIYQWTLRNIPEDLTAQVEVLLVGEQN
jgi:hypothetical protein